MKRNVEFKNFAPPQKVRGLIERLVQKVEKRENFPTRRGLFALDRKCC
jgi:hypothetical protein